jgi:hypothetical protein
MNRLEAIIIVLTVVAAGVAPWHIIPVDTAVQWITLMVLDLSWCLVAFLLIMQLHKRMTR